MSPPDPEQDEEWPREFKCYGEASAEMREDSALEGSEWWQGSCSHLAEEQGVKLVPGTKWDVTWYEVTQQEVDFNNSAMAVHGGKYWLHAGDWRFRAVGVVVPI